ncbi:hypothetical protein Adt_42405 [Abeliophyllum distichum]|uniref:Uncharacterized protein n=1 Tax=Abeliophyllum distichum TaxID=126358 RepID=A0ABD1PUC0_9LAMI
MAEKICELEEKADENEMEKQIEFPEDSDFNPRRQRDEIPEIVVQMLVQQNRVRVTLSSGRIVGDEKIGVENRAPTASHSHPYSDHRDSRRYQPINLLKERERRPARSASVFDRLGDEDDSHQRKTQFHDGRRVGSLRRDPICQPDYFYDDEGDGTTRSFEEDDNEEDLPFSHEIRSTPVSGQNRISIRVEVTPCITW